MYLLQLYTDYMGDSLWPEEMKDNCGKSIPMEQLTEVSLYYFQLITYLLYSKLAAIKVEYDKIISYVVPKFIILKVQFFLKLLIKKFCHTSDVHN